MLKLVLIIDQADDRSTPILNFIFMERHEMTQNNLKETLQRGTKWPQSDTNNAAASVSVIVP